MRVNNHSREQNPRFARVQKQTTIHASKIYSNSKVHPGFRISFFIASIIISFFTSWLDDQQRNENGHFIQETIDICLQQGTPTAQSLELVLGLYSCLKNKHQHQSSWAEFTLVGWTQKSEEIFLPK